MDHGRNQREVKQRLRVQARHPGLGVPDMGVEDRKAARDYAGERSNGKDQDGLWREVLEVERGGHEHYDRQRHTAQIDPLEGSAGGWDAAVRA